MRLRIKTAGLLGQYLPPGGKRNYAEMEFDEGVTPSLVMSALALPTEDSYLVSLNGVVVPQKERASKTLVDGDLLAIMPPLKGG